MKPVPHGEPHAGKLHVRFDEGYPPKNGEARFEGSRRPSGRPPRGVPLYSTTLTPPLGTGTPRQAWQNLLVAACRKPLVHMEEHPSESM